MKQEMKKNIKVYSVGLLIFLVGFLGAYFIQKVRYENEINKIYSFAPKIVYRKFYNYKTNEEIITPKISYGDWFNNIKDQNLIEYDYIRAFNKKYVIPEHNYNYPVKLTVKNQLRFYQDYNIINGKILDYKNKYWFEQELKKVTNKNFLILNINNVGQQQWIVDFETEITDKEIRELYKNLYNNTGIKYIISYNIIVNPKYFNDNINIDYDKYMKEVDIGVEKRSKGGW